MATHERETQRWVVESIDESVAGVEMNGESMARVPRWLLPANAQVGDVLAVTRESGAERVTVTVERDPAATQAALDASVQQMRDAPIDTQGGDVTL